MPWGVRLVCFWVPGLLLFLWYFLFALCAYDMFQFLCLFVLVGLSGAIYVLVFHCHFSFAFLSVLLLCSCSSLVAVSLHFPSNAVLCSVRALCLKVLSYLL